MTTDAASVPGLASRPHLGGVESLRAYAACAIVIFHVIHLTGMPIPRSLEFMKWYFAFGVPLFFVVSAFSLAYGYEGRLSSRSEVWQFYLRRVFRIAPLFYAMIAYTLVTTPDPSPTESKMGELVANLAFGFNLFPDLVEGITPASWSIGVEMVFYALFPLIMMAVRGPVSATISTLAAIVAAVFFGLKMDMLGDIPPGFIQHGFLFNLPYFGFGLIAYFAYRRLSPRLGRSALVAAVTGLLVLYAMAAWPTPLMPGRIGNTVFQALWGAPFALLCLAMAQNPPAFLSNRVTRFLGKISFSLYLTHPYVISALAGAGAYASINNLPGGSGVRFPVAVLVTLAVLTPLSWGLYQLIEEPGMNLGRRIARRALARRDAAPPATAVEPA
ncbi:MAG: acyltransferase [Phenylobacterium sp.]|nr:acyltransferase [Phenylobacterium sp.]HQT54353.1 acyltransferase [Phenylobacterium sp.]